jgi:signal transduction histidine kinase
MDAKLAAKSARKDIQQAISHIRNSPTLTSADKSRIVKQYASLAAQVEKQEEYSQQARRGLVTMGLLGVVAGFMTHESRAILHDLELTVLAIQRLAKKDRSLQKDADQLEHRLNTFRGYLDYSRLFIQSARVLRDEPLAVASQIRRIIANFGSVAKDRGIKVSIDVDESVKTPPLPVTAYSGILLNLFTNAVKGILAAAGSTPKPLISFRSWNEQDRHIVEVADNGIGIPPELRRRVFDPLFTTTSDVGNPLGSGMGLGLTLVEQVVREFEGRITLLEVPPPGFSTCFRVVFPRKDK